MPPGLRLDSDAPLEVVDVLGAVGEDRTATTSGPLGIVLRPGNLRIDVHDDGTVTRISAVSYG